MICETQASGMSLPHRLVRLVFPLKYEPTQMPVTFGAANRSRRVESAKNVGAHRPTKMPKRSAWARSGSLSRNQIAMDAMTERKPATKQRLLRPRHAELVIVVSLKKFAPTNQQCSTRFQSQTYKLLAAEPNAVIRPQWRTRDARLQVHDTPAAFRSSDCVILSHRRERDRHTSWGRIALRSWSARTSFDDVLAPSF